MTNRVDVQYYEEISAHPIIGIVILIGIGLLVFAGLQVPRTPRLILIFISALLGFIYLTFLKLTIIITSNRISVGYGFIKHNIRLSNIEYIETRHPPWYWYGGPGSRFGGDWSIGFIQNFGRGVRITPIHGRRFFFSTNNPEAIVNILNDLQQKQSQP